MSLNCHILKDTFPDPTPATDLYCLPARCGHCLLDSPFIALLTIAIDDLLFNHLFLKTFCYLFTAFLPDLTVRTGTRLGLPPGVSVLSSWPSVAHFPGSVQAHKL